MITKAQAIEASIGQDFYHEKASNADGTPLRARKNGQVKTWKTRLDEFRMPAKYGMYNCFYITHKNCQEWFATEEEALQSSYHRARLNKNASS